LRLSAVAAAAVVGAGGCALLVGLEAVVIEADGDAGEAGADVVDERAPPRDASTDPDVRARPLCAEIVDAGVDGGEVLFCDDFEEPPGSLGARYDDIRTGNGATIEVSQARSWSGTQSVRFLVPEPDGGPFVFASLVKDPFDGGPPPVFFEAEFLVDRAPAHPDPGAGYTAFALFTTPPDIFHYAMLAVPDGGINPFLFLGATAPIAAFPISEWYHVTFAIMPEGRSFVVTPRSGGGPFVRTQASPTDGGLQWFWFGAHNQAADLYVDDVVVHR
jgi:hypothetical protein